MAVGIAAFAAAASTGCGSSPSSSPVAVDKDGDHFTEAQGDCNDQNAAINPNGVVVVEACRWMTPQWDCPRGSNHYTEDQDLILVRVINNRCSTLTITSAAVETTVQDAQGTFNHVGETWTTEKLHFSPTSVPMGVGGDILVDAANYCTNPRGGAYNVYKASVKLETSAGVLTATTTNTRRTNFPFAGDASSATGAHALAGSGPAAVRESK